MSTTSRRFGTDVSNIPSDVLHKTPSKKIVNKSQLHAPKSNTKPTARVPEPKSSPLFDVMETLMDTFKISIDDEITVTSPVKLSVFTSDEFRYERDFLLKFQEICKEPIEDLIAEVIPGYVHPEPPMDRITSAPKLQVKFSSSQKTSTAKSSIINSNMPIQSEPSSSDAKSSTESATVTPKEWRVKKVKKQKPREQDARRLAARQKQIDIGMNTVGYQKFLESIPPSARTKTHPKIPDIHQVCSKRSWDGQVRKWRRQLHDFDPTPSAAGQHPDDGLAQNAAERYATSNTSSEDESSSDDGEGEL